MSIVRLPVVGFGVFLVLTLGVPVQGQGSLSCVEHEGFHRLDFWVGTWIVTDRASADTLGTNRITPILDGCAIMEFWRSARGGEGRSLFYYVPATDTWKQVWVTDHARRPGGVKEKTLVDTGENGSVGFQGEIAMPDGDTYLDRTTLTPLPNGRVRQFIERSTDGGDTWTPGFDAIYGPSESVERKSSGDE